MRNERWALRLAPMGPSRIFLVKAMWRAWGTGFSLQECADAATALIDGHALIASPTALGLLELAFNEYWLPRRSFYPPKFIVADLAIADDAALVGYAIGGQAYILNN